MVNVDLSLAQSSEIWSRLIALVGLKLRCIYLITYEYKGSVTSTNLFPQLLFENGSSMFFSPAADGESLKVDQIPWIDSFSNKDDPNTRDYLVKFGEWIQQDVSSVDPYMFLIGFEVVSILPIEHFGKLVGVIIEINHHQLKIVIEWDECHIFCKSSKSSLEK